MPTTPLLGLRYPAASEPADIPTDMGELATDIESALGTQVPSCRVRHSTTQTFTVSGSNQSVLFDTEMWDVGNLHNTVTNNNRLTVTKAGIYLVSGNVLLTATATGQASLRLLDGSAGRQAETSANFVTGSLSQSLVISALVQLAASGWVELAIVNSTTANLVTSTAAVLPTFAITLLKVT